LAALAPDHQYRQSTIEMLLPRKGHDWSFRTSGRVPLVSGWKAILGGAASADEGIELPAVKDKEPGEVLKTDVRKITTRPPARYTEGSLIRVMQEAWRLVDDPEMRARLKEAKGIGTPATRGNILKGLFTQGQLATKGKQILPTEGGLKLYQTLGEVCPNVVDPVRTARWETLFDSVEKGHMEAEDAVRKILAGVSKEIERIVARAGSVQVQIGKAQKPTSKMAAVAKTISERKGIPLPRGCLSDSSVCRKFLDEHLPKRESGQGGAGGSFGPSEKQLAFASRLAEETGTELTTAAKASSKDLSAWIDAVQAKAGPRRPSDKQLAFARKLAGEKGEDLPAEAHRDAEACSAFIDRMMGKGGGAGKGRTSAKASAPGIKGKGRVVRRNGAMAPRPRQPRSRFQG
jgi:DNA topoisomerase-3